LRWEENCDLMNIGDKGSIFFSGRDEHAAHIHQSIYGPGYGGVRGDEL
jgi:hypothetical protein